MAAGRAHQSLPWKQVLREPQYWIILLMYHTYCWGSFFFLSWMITFLARGRGFSETELAVFAPLPFIFGGTANLAGGLVSDHLVRKLGLKWGRRAVAFGGLTAAAVFTLATTFTSHKIASVVLLGLAYAGSDFMLPVAWAVCLDVGRKYAGAVTGSMNMAGQVGSFLSATLFGYLVGWFGTYNAPLYPMSVMLAISALLWLKIDPTRQLVREPKAVPAVPGHV
jgi:predicted MFS family arabinose efflux permease